jgi:hypothetical protein
LLLSPNPIARFRSNGFLQFLIWERLVWMG